MKIIITVKFSEKELVEALKNNLLLKKEEAVSETRTLETFLIDGMPTKAEIMPVKPALKPQKVKKSMSKPNQKPKPTEGLNLRKAQSKSCDWCNKTYAPRSNAQHYCSDECKAAAKAEKKADPESDPEPAHPDEPSISVNTLSLTYKDILKEREDANQEQAILDSLRDHPKIDWKIASKVSQLPHDTSNI